MNPENCIFSDSDKLGIGWDHPHCLIKVKFCVVGGLQEIVLRFEFHQNQSSGYGAAELKFAISHWFVIGLYKIVISQQIKEAIANRQEKLNKLMIAQTP